MKRTIWRFERRIHVVRFTHPYFTGLLGVDDQAQLAFARSENRVLLTHDADFLSIVADGLDHAGICYCRQQSRSVRQMIEVLFLLHECYQADDMRNHVEFL